MVDVLDHGFVELIEHMGDDNRIVEAARVSVAGAATFRPGDKLIHYLWENGHTGPFEHVVFTFRVKAPIFVLRQWMRHRTWSFNEISGRYSVLTDEFYLPDVDQVREQSKSNKQGRDKILPNAAYFRSMIEASVTSSIFRYDELIEAGMAREIARLVMPVSLYSEMVATVDLNNLFKFLTLRADEHAQWEIRQYAYAIEKLIKPHVPIAYAAWQEGR